MDEFEKFLSKQPMRELPSAWRSEILPALPKPKAARPWWQEWLWPSPVAWAGLAAVWVVIIGLNLAARSPTEQTASQTSVPSVDMVAALANQRRLLADLTSPPVSEPPTRQAAPGPRSELLVQPREV
jgi:hypothetical protein